MNGDGSYDDVVRWVKIIKTEFSKNFNLNALTTITKFSLPYPREIVDEFTDLGFNGVWLRFLNNLGYAHPKIKEIGYSPKEYVKFWKESLDYIIEKNKSGRIFQESFTKILSYKILNRRDPMFLDIQSPCGAGIGQLLYDHRGDIFTCDEAKILGDTFKLGNVGESSLKEIINHPTTLAMMNISTKLTTLCDSCAWSPYCGICPIDIYMSQNTIVPKLTESFRCQVLKEMIKTIFEKILFSPEDRTIILNWLNFPPFKYL